MLKKQISIAGCAGLVAIVIGGALAGCTKSGTADAQPTTTAATVASSSTSSPGQSTAPPPASGQTVKAADGSFTVTLPDSLNVDPAKPNAHSEENLIFAPGNGMKSMFMAGVLPSEFHGNTCQDSLAKAGSAVSKKLHATIDPGGVIPSAK